MGESECPAGDECNCVMEASNGQVESWSALQAALYFSGKRARRISVPARLMSFDNESDEGFTTRAASLYGVDEDDERGGEEWESVASSHEIHAQQGGNGAKGGMYELGTKPAIQGDEPVSAARLSLGNRLKKSLAERPAVLRRKSGGVPGWKRTTGLG
jgi:hypothetical protein